MATKDISDHAVCAAYEEAARGTPPWPEEILHERTGEQIKVCLRAMERAADRGLIDYGVTLRSGWLTDSGRELLRPK